MGVIESTRTNVVMLDLDNAIRCAQIQKGDDTILVLQSHEYVIIVDKDVEVWDNDPFVKLAKMYSRHDLAYNEWMRLIGKMCKKEYTSKYFGNPILGDHLKNGRFPSWARDDILKIARLAVATVKYQAKEE